MLDCGSPRGMIAWAVNTGLRRAIRTVVSHGKVSLGTPREFGGKIKLADIPMGVLRTIFSFGENCGIGSQRAGLFRGIQ